MKVLIAFAVGFTLATCGVYRLAVDAMTANEWTTKVDIWTFQSGGFYLRPNLVGKRNWARFHGVLPDDWIISEQVLNPWKLAKKPKGESFHMTDVTWTNWKPSININTPFLDAGDEYINGP